MTDVCVCMYVNIVSQHNQPTNIQREFFTVGHNDVVWWKSAAFLEECTDSILRIIEG
jgi:hypothetical protein